MAKSKSAQKVKDPKAKFYRRSSGGQWFPFEKGFGGTLSDITNNEFSYPGDLTNTGEIIFDNGEIYSVGKDRVNLGDNSELLKTLTKQQAEINKQNKSKK